MSKIVKFWKLIKLSNKNLNLNFKKMEIFENFILYQEDEKTLKLINFDTSQLELNKNV